MAYSAGPKVYGRLSLGPAECMLSARTFLRVGYDRIEHVDALYMQELALGTWQSVKQRTAGPKVHGTRSLGPANQSFG